MGLSALLALITPRTSTRYRRCGAINVDRKCTAALYTSLYGLLID